MNDNQLYESTIEEMDLLYEQIADLKALLTQWQGWGPKNGFEKSQDCPDGYYFCMVCGGTGSTNEEIEHNAPCVVNDTRKALGGNT